MSPSNSPVDGAEHGAAEELVQRAFGESNRSRLLEEYFEGRGRPVPEQAWRDVYTLLLAVDPTTGLARCYESDKSQPGRPWYERTLRFHGFVAESLGIDPMEVATTIDWLFKRVVIQLERTWASSEERRKGTAVQQRTRNNAEGYPSPGRDPEFRRVVRERLVGFLDNEPTDSAWDALSLDVRNLLARENKRKNLAGEGFEDTLSHIIRAWLPAVWRIKTRVPTTEIAGFAPVQRSTGKRKKVDLALWTVDEARRVLITAKWSVRADREEQFASEYAAYKLENAIPASFEYVLVTNEFDPARLCAACDAFVQSDNRPLFSKVVHVNPAAVLAAYGTRRSQAMQRVALHVEAGRLESLERFLLDLVP